MNFSVLDSFAAAAPCRYGSECKNQGSGCRYSHPKPQKAGNDVACRYGDSCKKREAGCPFVHPLPVCRYGDNCKNRESGCPYMHSKIARSQGLANNARPQGLARGAHGMCQYHALLCSIPGCTKKHREGLTSNTASPAELKAISELYKNL